MNTLPLHGKRRCASQMRGRVNPRPSSILPRAEQGGTEGKSVVAPFSRKISSMIQYVVVAAIIFAASPAFAQGQITIDAKPITYFDNHDKTLRRFGKLEFRGGLDLTSKAREFGGVSGLHVYPDGARFIAVTDTGRWLRGRIVYSGSAPSGIADAEMAPILGPDGKTLKARGWYDTESLTEEAGTIYVGIERVQRILKFDFGKSGFQSRGTPITVPADFRTMPSNGSLEAVALVPKGLPLAGTLIVISEAALDASGNNRAYFIGGPHPGSFTVKRSDNFDITDCKILPNGDVLILERRFSLLGSGSRMRRIAAGDLRPGALVDPPIIFSADFGQQIDNFEGLGLHRTAAGETVLTLVSDNNFFALQRTLLMQFTLVE